ncbi:MAG TPA: squalene/phytoene synthase family protein [Myxococcota bacterium]|nr:squalene/phytoene synthase family protein [Myxococcota bacterium]HRY93228.1 squalene/phytoene synthase family protein [Myxococcota bacterium]HSA21043.1 squalene/phytoene synthase family protein [Myxococcota bacterium]
MSHAAAMAACRAVLARSGSSFRTAFRLLPAEPRDALTAFYAYCREVDDAVDEAPDELCARRALAGWRARLEAALAGRPGGPVEEALAWAAGRYRLPRAHLELVIEGVEQDLAQRRFRTFQELHAYCYRVASAVGLVCAAVQGGRGAEVELYAELSGVAVQLTNVLRDLGEDAARGRIYLPLEDLEAFGVSEADILGRRPTPALGQLLRFEAARAQALYAQAAAALPPALAARLYFCEALRETYQRLLARLVAADLPVFGARVSLPAWEKLLVVLRRRLSPAALWAGRA